MIIFKKVELIHTLLWGNNHMCKQNIITNILYILVYITNYKIE